MKLELAHLRSFVHVANAESIRAAAAELGISQPAVSGHMRSLEAAVGRGPLFERSSSGVILTAAGLQLYDRAEPHVRGLERLVESSADDAQLVVIGGPLDFMSIKLLPRLTASSALGRVGISLQPAIAETNMRRLEDRVIDLFVASRPVEPGDAKLSFVQVPLYEEEYVLVGGAAWGTVPDDEEEVAARLSKSRWLVFDEQFPLVREHPFVARHRKTIFSDLPMGEWTERAAFIVPDFRALRELAVAGAGVAAIPRYVVEAELASGRLVELGAIGESKMNTIYLVYRDPSSEAPRPAVQAAIDALMEIAPDLTD